MPSSLTHQSAGSQVWSLPSRSSSENQGVTTDPNIAWRRSIAQTEVGQLESGSEEHFEDSRDNLPPKNQTEPPTSIPNPTPGSGEVAVPLVPMSSSSFGGPIPSGEVDPNLVEDRVSELRSN